MSSSPSSPLPTTISSITYRIATLADLPACAELVCTSLQTNSLDIAIKSKPSEFFPHCQILCEKWIKEGLSVIAVKPHATTTTTTTSTTSSTSYTPTFSSITPPTVSDGSLIGSIICNDAYNERPSSQDIEKYHEYQKTGIMKGYHEIEPFLLCLDSPFYLNHPDFPSSSVLFLHFLMVHPSARGASVSSHLSTLLAQHARNHQYTSVITEAAHPATWYIWHDKMKGKVYTEVDPKTWKLMKLNESNDDTHTTSTSTSTSTSTPDAITCPFATVPDRMALLHIPL